MTTEQDQRRRCRGQTLTEFGLVAMVLSLLFAGMLDLARAWNIADTLTIAVRDGARVAALTSEDKREAAASARVKTTAATAFSAKALDEDLKVVLVEGTTGGGNSVPIVTVTASANVPMMFGDVLRIGRVVNGERVFTITRSATFRDEVKDPA